MDYNFVYTNMKVVDGSDSSSGGHNKKAPLGKSVKKYLSTL
jgi:hypothetical protein